MALTFLVSLVAIALLFATLCKYELTAKHTRAQLRALRRRLSGERRRRGGRRRSAAPEPGTAPGRPRGGRRSLPVSALVLAEMPALPLHTAGKYVAGAYIVLFAIVLIYVAIMAIRLSHIERELGELLDADRATSRASRRSSRDARAGVGAGMSELLALGISHKTAPVALRERLAFTEREAVEFARAGRPPTPRCARRS